MSILPNSSTSDRLLRVDQVTVSPGQCVFCGKNEHSNGFIDTGLDFDEWGRVYICFDEARNIANLIGFGDPNKIAEVEAENQELATSLIAAEEEITKLRTAINALRSLDNYPTEPGAVVPANPFDILSAQPKDKDENPD